MRWIKRPRKIVEEAYTFAKEALWFSMTAAILVLGIVGYAAWSLHAKGYAHIDVNIAIVAFLCVIMAAMFVSLWWSRRVVQRRKRRPQ